MNKYILIEIGQKLKKIRKEKGLTVQTIAYRAGVSKGLISRVENGRTVPSLPVLIAVIKGLDIPINTFFDDIDLNALQEVAVKKANELEPQNDIATDQLLRYPIINKNVPESLVKTSILELQPQGIGGEKNLNGFTFQHIIEGEVLYQINDEIYELASGDSIYFDARIKHQILNNTNDIAKIIVMSFVL